MGFMRKIVQAISAKTPSYGVVPAEVEGLTGLPAAELMLKFESLGDNCEFGLVQRGGGAEPLGLLRFSFLGLRHLMRALESGFAELGAPDNMEVYVSDHPRREYVMRDRRFEMSFHTNQYEADGADSTVLARHLGRIDFLRRKLQDDLAAGEKILVLKRNIALNDEEIGAVYRLVQRCGRNTLLVVLPAGQDRVPGTVEEVEPGLLKGYIDRFAPYEYAPDISLESWLSICVHAYLLNLRRRETTA